MKYICPNCRKIHDFSDNITEDELWDFDACNVFSTAHIKDSKERLVPRCSCGNNPIDTGIFFRMVPNVNKVEAFSSQEWNW